MKKNTKYNFKKGSVEMLLLHILKEEGDCYGYQLSQMISSLSDGILLIPEGSLYPALYKLLDNDYISEEKRLVGKRLTRVYYHIKPSGEDRLNQLVQEYYDANNAIQKILSYTKGDTK
jgi:Predicted transcriptional regulators